MLARLGRTRLIIIAMIAVLIIGGGAAIAAAASMGGGSAADPSAPPSDPAVATCADFIAGDQAYKASLTADRPSSPTFEAKAASAKADTWIWVNVQCKDESRAGMTISDLLTDHDTEGRCETFLSLPENSNTPAVWLQAAAQATGVWQADWDVEILKAVKWARDACAASPDTTLTALSTTDLSDVMDGVLAQATAEDEAAAQAQKQQRQADLAAHTWHFANESGYAFDVVLQAGGATSTAPDGTGLESICSFDPLTDIAIPFTAKLTPVTQGFDTNVAANFSITHRGGEYAGGGTPPSSGDDRIRIALFYSGGPTCQTKSSTNPPISFTGTEGKFGIQYNDPTPAGKTLTWSFVLIVKDYRTPASPSGEQALLDWITVVPMASDVNGNGFGDAADFFPDGMGWDTHLGASTRGVNLRNAVIGG